MKHAVALVLLAFTASSAAGGPPDAPPKKPPQSRAEAQALMDDAARDFASMQASHKRIVESHDRLALLARKAAEDVGARAQGLKDLIRDKAAQEALLDAVKGLEEARMGFNLQYLQLQSQMQHENRSYTAISNIMKTKHDTVKNSISNIR